MNRAQTLAAIKALPYMVATYSSEWEQYRVTIKGLSKGHAERVAYYADDAGDALDTARAMSARHADRQAKEFANAKAASDMLNISLQGYGDALKAVQGIGTGQMGLTPDSVKRTPAYQTAKVNYDTAFAAVRSFNANYVKLFAVELALERAARRATVEV